MFSKKNDRKGNTVSQLRITELHVTRHYTAKLFIQEDTSWIFDKHLIDKAKISRVMKKKKLNIHQFQQTRMIATTTDISP